VLSTPQITTPHGFFGRTGGVSTGIFDSLNISYASSDATTNVDANRRICAEKLGMIDAPVLTLKQTHSAICYTVIHPFDSGNAPAGDALVTSAKGLILGVQTADCAPVLFHDAEAGVIGAAHAGWKGALTGVLEATVTAMVRIGATLENITAVIGPCIRQPSYEVDAVFYQTFLAESAAYQTFFKDTESPLHFQFDLAGFVRFRLYGAGVGMVEDVEQDTLSQPTDYFSFRRATLAGEQEYGRQLSAIALN
jgi:polyphenol oxidase